jgi:hypothetical protein
MGLYTSFNPANYYDEDIKQQIKEENKTKQQHIIQSKEETPPPIPQKIKKSLYAEAKKQLEKMKEKPKVNFKETYRVGQKVAIVDKKGNLVTQKGKIAEIVAEDLMYVYMEDTYKDVNGNWLVGFVTAEDKIYPL